MYFNPSQRASVSFRSAATGYESGRIHSVGLTPNGAYMTLTVCGQPVPQGAIRTVWAQEPVPLVQAHRGAPTCKRCRAAAR